MIVPMLAVLLGAAMMVTLGIYAMGELDTEPCDNFDRENPPRPVAERICFDALAWTENVYSFLMLMIFVLPGLTLVMSIWMWQRD